MISVASFDLECTSLNADFGIVLCAVVKPQGQDPIVFRADELNKNWKTKRSDDSEIVKAIIDELNKHDLLCAHNGVRFDQPFLNTRALKAGCAPMKPAKFIDPVLLARRNMKMSWNSLEKIADFLGCNTKTPVDGSTWLRASLDGDRDAMDEVVEHCVQDVLMLEKIVHSVKHFCPSYNTKGSWL